MYNIESQHEKCFYEKQKDLFKGPLAKDNQRLGVSVEPKMVEFRRPLGNLSLNANVSLSRNAFSLDKASNFVREQAQVPNSLQNSHDSTVFKATFGVPTANSQNMIYSYNSKIPSYSSSKPHGALQSAAVNMFGSLNTEVVLPTLSGINATTSSQYMINNSRPIVSLNIPKYKVRQHSNQKENLIKPKENDIALKKLIQEQNQILNTYKDSANQLLKERDEYINDTLLLKEKINQSRNVQLNLINKLNYHSYVDKIVEDQISSIYTNQGQSFGYSPNTSQSIMMQKGETTNTNLTFNDQSNNMKRSEDAYNFVSKIECDTSSAVDIRSVKGMGIHSVKRMINPMKIKLEGKNKMMVTSQSGAVKSWKLKGSEHSSKISSLTNTRGNSPVKPIEMPTKEGEIKEEGIIFSDKRTDELLNKNCDDVLRIEIHEEPQALNNEDILNEQENHIKESTEVTNEQSNLVNNSEADPIKSARKEDSSIKEERSQSNPSSVYMKKAKPVFKLKKADFTNVRHAVSVKSGSASNNDQKEEKKTEPIPKINIPCEPIQFEQKIFSPSSNLQIDKTESEISLKVDDISQKCKEPDTRRSKETLQNMSLRPGKLNYKDLANMSEIQTPLDSRPSTGILNPKLELMSMFSSIKESANEIKKTNENIEILKKKQQNISKNQSLIASFNNPEFSKTIIEENKNEEDREEEPDIVLKSNKIKGL